MIEGNEKGKCMTTAAAYARLSVARLGGAAGPWVKASLIRWQSADTVAFLGVAQSAAGMPCYWWTWDELVAMAGMPSPFLCKIDRDRQL
jgi:hypothetical protein